MKELRVGAKSVAVLEESIARLEAMIDSMANKAG